jgi:serine protease Do
MKFFSKPVFGFFAAMLGTAAVIVFVHFTSWGREPGPAIAVETTPVNRSASPVTSYAPVIKKAAPSVVNIYSTRTVREKPTESPLHNDPIIRHFFGDQPNDDRERTRKEESLGSGVIISPDGYILTANHVVQGASDVLVAIADGKKEFTAKIVGTDPPTDVAVLKIDAKDLPAVTLGDSDQLEVGDVLLAIGNPFGLGQTVTMGIVSATGRGGLGINGNGGYENFIQTDAAINEGNSGGALVDAEGRLVGINTAIISPSGGNDGIGFAVPIDMARSVMERLISGGKITRGYIGVFPQDITPGLAEGFNLPDESGALVGGVMANAPAEKAGIKSGDVIVAVDGKKITDANNLRLLISDMTPGAKVNVKLIRNGSEKTVAVAVAELPQPAQNPDDQKISGDENPTKADALDGVTVMDLDRRVRMRLNIPIGLQGALVADVNQDSNADDAGLARGDVIIEVNRQPVPNAAAAVDLCRNAKGGQILLQVWHREPESDIGTTHYLSVDNKK